MQNTDKSYALSFGLKFRLIDKADLRINSAFLNFIDKTGPLINTSFVEAATQLAFKWAPIWNITPREAREKICL